MFLSNFVWVLNFIMMPSKEPFNAGLSGLRALTTLDPILSFSCSSLTSALCYACIDSFSSLSCSFIVACSVYSRDSFLLLSFSCFNT